MNKRGFLATLAAMCLAPFAAKADPIDSRRKKALALTNAWTRGRWQPVEVHKDHVFYDFAEKDGAIIEHWIKWEAPDRTHWTALGHYENGAVWHWTYTAMREP